MNRWILALVFCAYSAGLSAAAVRYTYQGPAFTNIQPGLPSGITSLSGYFETDAPLASNLDIGTTTSVTDFRFTDGASTLTTANGFISAAAAGVNVSTDGDGNIDEWWFTVSADDLEVGKPNRFNSSKQSSPTIDESNYCLTLTEAGCNGAFASSPGAGTWVMTAVPVPAAFWLFGSALGLVGFMHSRVA